MRKNTVLLHTRINEYPVTIDLNEVHAIQLRNNGEIAVYMKSTTDNVFQCKLTQPGDTKEYTAEEYFTMYKSLVNMWGEVYPLKYEIGDSLVKYSDALFSYLVSVNAGEAAHTVTIDRDVYEQLLKDSRPQR